jgi:hypothetical protein
MNGMSRGMIGVDMTGTAIGPGASAINKAVNMAHSP